MFWLCFIADITIVYGVYEPTCNQGTWNIWGFPWMGIPQNGWFTMGKSIYKWMMTGGTGIPVLILGNLHIWIITGFDTRFLSGVLGKFCWHRCGVHPAFVDHFPRESLGFPHELSEQKDPGVFSRIQWVPPGMKSTRGRDTNSKSFIYTIWYWYLILMY